VFEAPGAVIVNRAVITGNRKPDRNRFLFTGYYLQA